MHSDIMSKKLKGKYRIITDDDRFPIELNMKRTDETLSEMKVVLAKFNLLLKKTHEEDPDLYGVIVRQVFPYSGIDVDDGSALVLKYLEDSVGDLIRFLKTHDDDVKKRDELETLEDIGYKRPIETSNIDVWEKMIEDCDDREVVDELLFNNTSKKVFHRLRTIEWERTHCGKSSRSISYSDLPIGKDLRRVIKNTVGDAYCVPQKDNLRKERIW